MLIFLFYKLKLLHPLHSISHCGCQLKHTAWIFSALTLCFLTCPLLPDTTDASGSSQQWAFQQHPVSAAWTGSASGVAASSHALLLRVRVVPHPTHTHIHSTHTHTCRVPIWSPGGSKQQQFGVIGCWCKMHGLSLNNQYYLSLFLLLFRNCTLWHELH